MNKTLKRIIKFTLFITILFISFIANEFYKTFFTVNTKFTSKTFSLYIKPNTDFNLLIIQLDSLLKSTHYFKIAANKKGYDSRVKSGLFLIPKDINNNEIINILRSKSEPVTVIFNNHERLENLAGRVSKQIYLDSLTLVNAFYNYDFLTIKGFNPKNAISMYLPNSYQFFWDTSVKNFQDKMWESYNSFWNKERLDKAKNIGLSPIEVSTLASIVQRETFQKDERPRIAGVYLNRIKKRMRLQADPTVIYAIKDINGDFNTKIRRVLYKDLKIKSPYNTYRNMGLPPGPITMPDIDAIESVLNPEKHSYLYFVADPQNKGYHLFAKNLREHNRNKKKYIKWINRKKVFR